MAKDTYLNSAVKTYSDGQITFDHKITHNSAWFTTANTYNQLFELASSIEASVYQGIRPKTLELYGLIGMRSDRRFSETASFDLKVICNFINNLGFEKHEVFEPHSDVVLALLHNAKPIWWKRNIGNKTIVYPDAGAAKRYTDIVGPGIVMIKHRDDTGAPTVQFTSKLPNDADCIIVDDYCDGGRTFAEAARLLKTHGAKHVTLSVAHGLFSYGFEQLADIDEIHTTNSLQKIQSSTLIEDATKHKIKLTIEKVI